MPGRGDELGPREQQPCPSHERISRHAQGAGDAEDGDQRRVPEPPLEFRDVVQGEAGLVCDLLLGETLLEPKLADDSAEGLLVLAGGHRRMVSATTTMVYELSWYSAGCVGLELGTPTAEDGGR